MQLHSRFSVVVILSICSFVTLSVVEGFSSSTGNGALLSPYTSPVLTSSSSIPTRRSTSALRAVSDDSSSSTCIWLPRLRKIMAGIATAGALETSYLTYSKLTNQVDSLLCGVDGGDCQSVLTGPYSNLPFTEIPLSALGLVAYLTTAGLALQPLLSSSDDDSSAEDGTDDTWNRIALTTVTTGMATFSVLLMSLLFGVLQTSCPYCVFSAACSIILAKLAWLGGCLPTTTHAASAAIEEASLEVRKAGAQAVTSSFLAATLTAIALFVSVDDSFAATSNLPFSANGGSPQQEQLYSPPSITTKSSPEALKLASQLESLNSKMYGAYWCSHCFDQKEALGKEAFAKISYVECSKDGINSQTKLCRANEVPGYPTWEINGELYPGEKDLEELEELLQTIQSKSK